jgi:MFS family permease
MNTVTTEPGKFYGWISLAVVAVMYFIMVGFMLYTFQLFLPILCNEFGWSRASVSWANSLALIVIGISTPFAGMFVARFGARTGIIIGNILCTLCFVLLFFHSQLWQLFIAYALFFGLGGSLGGILPTTTIANNWFVRKRSLALSLILAAGGLGGLVMIPATNSLIDSFGWRYTYLIIASAALVCMVILPAILVKNRPEDLGQVPDGIRQQKQNASAEAERNIHSTPVDFTAAEAVRSPALWLITAFGTMHMFALQGLLVHQVAFLRDIGISAGTASFAAGLFTGISTVGRLGLGFLGLKYRMRSLAILSMVILIVGMVILLFTESLLMVFAYVTVVGIGMGATLVAIMNLIPLYFGKTHYPKIVGYTVPFTTIIGSFGAPLAGRIYDTSGSYTWAWQAAILCLIISLIFLLLARPPVHPSLKNNQAS